MLREELESYKGVVSYLPHHNPKSKSTPIRIVFDASRSQGGRPSLNDLLAKGPDRYLNNLAAVVTGFKDGRFAAQGDVKKMFNAVKLPEADSFVQCFLWQNMDEKADPETYQVVRNNMCVKPLGSIAKTALDLSADKYAVMYPSMAQQLKDKSYVDDLGVTDEQLDSLKQRTVEADEIIADAGMQVHK